MKPPAPDCHERQRRSRRRPPVRSNKQQCLGMSRNPRTGSCRLKCFCRSRAWFVSQTTPAIGQASQGLQLFEGPSKSPCAASGGLGGEQSNGGAGSGRRRAWEWRETHERKLSCRLKRTLFRSLAWFVSQTAPAIGQESQGLQLGVRVPLKIPLCCQWRARRPAKQHKPNDADGGTGCAAGTGGTVAHRR